METKIDALHKCASKDLLANGAVNSVDCAGEVLIWKIEMTIEIGKALIFSLSVATLAVTVQLICSRIFLSHVMSQKQQLVNGIPEKGCKFIPLDSRNSFPEILKKTG